MVINKNHLYSPLSGDIPDSPRPCYARSILKTKHTLADAKQVCNITPLARNAWPVTMQWNNFIGWWRLSLPQRRSCLEVCENSRMEVLDRLSPFKLNFTSALHRNRKIRDKTQHLQRQYYLSSQAEASILGIYSYIRVLHDNEVDCLIVCDHQYKSTPPKPTVSSVFRLFCPAMSWMNDWR